MKRNNYSTGAKCESIVGYSRAVAIGNTVEVSGTVSIKDGKPYGINDPYVQTQRILEIVGDALQHLDDQLNCGCQGPCPQGILCIGGRCDICLPERHQRDNLDCGCNGPCAPGDQCQAGSCDCNVLENLENSQNCGCAGPCERGMSCHMGACLCMPNFQRCEPSESCVDGVCQ